MYPIKVPDMLRKGGEFGKDVRNRRPLRETHFRTEAGGYILPVGGWVPLSVEISKSPAQALKSDSPTSARIPIAPKKGAHLCRMRGF